MDAKLALLTGRWGMPSQVLLDITAEPDGTIRGIANPGRQNVTITRGHFDVATDEIKLEGDHRRPNGTTLPFRIMGRLDGRTLRLAYEYGEQRGTIAIVRIEEYEAPRPGIFDALKYRIEEVKRWVNAFSRPKRGTNVEGLRARGESLDTIIFRDAIAADIPALAALHVTTWNATYNTNNGPTIATRTWQWNKVFTETSRSDFVLVLEDRTGRLIGFTWGKPGDGNFDGVLSKIYLRWEYHGLGLGRRMMVETARRFLDRGMRSFVLHAELSNPTLGFYDRMGGERLLNDKGQFDGAYAWRDLERLVHAAPSR